MNFLNNRSFEATEDVYVSRIVSLAGDFKVEQADAADTKLIGISQEGQKGPPGLSGSTADLAAAAGDTLRVYGPGEECMLTLGDTVSYGDYVGPDTDGKGVAISLAAETLQHYIAVALEAGIAGDKIRVVVNKGAFLPAEAA